MGGSDTENGSEFCRGAIGKMLLGRVHWNTEHSRGKYRNPTIDHQLGRFNAVQKGSNRALFCNHFMVRAWAAVGRLRFARGALSMARHFLLRRLAGLRQPIARGQRAEFQALRTAQDGSNEQ